MLSEYNNKKSVKDDIYDFIKKPARCDRDNFYTQVYSLKNHKDHIYDIGENRYKITSYEDAEGNTHEYVSVERERIITVFGPQGYIPEKYWEMSNKTPEWVREQAKKWQKIKFKAIHDLTEE